MIAKTLIDGAFRRIGIRFQPISGNESATTGEQIVAASLRKLSLLNSTSNATDIEINDGIEVLNDMLAEWQYDGIDLGTKTITKDAASNLPDWSLSGVKSALAVRIATEYNRPITESLAAEATKSVTQLQERTATTLYADGLSELTGLILEWDVVGRRLGYLNPVDENGETGLPDWTQLAIETNLAVRLAPVNQKQVTQELFIAARESKANMVKRLTRKPMMGMPSSLPAGSGNECEYGSNDRFYPENPDELLNQVDAIDTGENVTISLEGSSYEQ